MNSGALASNIFNSLSLGSILLLIALGLAITFGLMRVINMAHGEFIMAGAYATYVTQNFFQNSFPNLIGWYLIVSIPFAFGVAALLGWLLEATVIRRLYGRPSRHAARDVGRQLDIATTGAHHLRFAGRERAIARMAAGQLETG
jgi:branched-subunit amino acid ABC-type transport system permease component